MVTVSLNRKVQVKLLNPTNKAKDRTVAEFSLLNDADDSSIFYDGVPEVHIWN